MTAGHTAIIIALLLLLAGPIGLGLRSPRPPRYGAGHRPRPLTRAEMTRRRESYNEMIAAGPPPGYRGPWPPDFHDYPPPPPGGGGVHPRRQP